MQPPSAFTLAEQPFLRAMEWRHLEALAACAMGVRFPAGEHIFRVGEPANRFYLLTAGRVALEAPSPGHAPAPVQIIAAGDVLGWSWLVPPYEWRFDARTLEPVEAVFFYGTRLRELADEDPAFCCGMLKRMTNVILGRLQSARDELVKARAR
jgi:CRP/FNR family transcriptional regulator, cyclic AMP receptor protein